MQARGFKPAQLGEQPDQGDVVLEEAPRAAVKVVDPGGRPVSAAQVWWTEDLERTPLAQLLSSDPPVFVGTTDLEGLFSVSLEEGCLFASRYPLLPSSLEGCSAAGSEQVLTLRSPGAVRGVVTVSGVPERGVFVTDSADEGWAVTDAEGRYELGILTPGPVELRFARQFTSGDSATIFVRRLVLRDEGVARFDLALGGDCALDVEVKVREAMTISLGISSQEVTPTRNTPARIDLRRIWVEAGSTVIHFDGLPSGRSWVVSGPEGEEVRSAPVELKEGVVGRTTASIAR